MERRYNLGICLFVWLDTLLLALIIITAYYMLSEKDDIVSYNANMCVPCTHLKIHPDDNIDGIAKTGINKTICCAKDKEKTDVLVGYFVDRWLKEKLAKDDRQFMRYKCGNETSKPAIKLVGKTEVQNVKHHKVHWDHESDAAIMPEDNSFFTHHVEHGFIEIKQAGLYQLYSQVVLNHDMNTPDPYNAPSMYQHSVVRIEAGQEMNGKHRERIILRASNSHCSSRSDRQTVTSYLGGAFQFAEGDKLAVKVYNKTEVVPVPHMNFFGVHML